MEITFCDPSVQIRVIRAILGMTSKAFAKVVGVAQNTVTGWESGRSVPNASSRFVIAELCKSRGIVFRKDMPLPKEEK